MTYYSMYTHARLYPENRGRGAKAGFLLVTVNHESLGGPRFPPPLNEALQHNIGR